MKNLKFFSEGHLTACRLCSIFMFFFSPFSGYKLCWTRAIHLVSMQTTLWPSVVYLWCRYLCSLLPQCQFHLHWERHRPACWSLQVCLTHPFLPPPPPLPLPHIHNSVIQSIEPSQLNIYTFCLKLDLFCHLMCCKRVSKISSCCWISWWVNLMDTRIEVAHYEGATINQASSCTSLKFPFCQFIAVQLQHHARHRLPTFQLIFVHVIESLVFVPVSIHFYFICMHIYQTILKLS